MKRAHYAVGLDSTLDAIRKLDYERGLEDAAQLCDDAFAFPNHLGQCTYEGDMGEAIRAYKSSPSPSPAPNEPTEAQLLEAFADGGLRKVYGMGMEDA